MNRPATILTALLTVFSVSIQPLPAFAEPLPAEIPPEASVVMSEIYPDAALNPEQGNSAEHEFIELHNRSEEAVPLGNLLVVRNDDLTDDLLEGTAIFSGSDLAPGEYRIFNPPFSLLNGGTVIELYYVDAEGNRLLVQQVDYSGNTPDDASSLQLFDDEWNIASPPTPNGPTEEPVADTSEPDNTDQNGGGTSDNDSTPTTNNDTDGTNDDDQPNDTSNETDGTDNTAACSVENIHLSEILANPSGSDMEGGEFIELYNSNSSPASLLGCTLSTDKPAAYEFSESDIIPAKSYRAFPLHNELLNGGGTVTFVAAEYEEVVAYPQLDDDEAYALLDNQWQTTLKPTPDEANALPTAVDTATAGLGALAPCPAGKFRNPATNRCKSVGSASPLKPCAADQFRNPVTSRCKKKAAADNELKACSADQSRNPITNRCKKIALASSALQPCAADQFRNPETNRCKKKENGDDLKPCKEGYERNPETNRCRKESSSVNGATSLAEDGGTGSAAMGHNIALVAIAASFLAFFLLYEYRLSIRGWFARVRPIKTTS